MSEFLLILLSMSLSGTLAALVLFLLRPLLKRNMSRSWMYYIWIITALRMLLPFGPQPNLIGRLIPLQAENRLVYEAEKANSDVQSEVIFPGANQAVSTLTADVSTGDDSASEGNTREKAEMDAAFSRPSDAYRPAADLPAALRLPSFRRFLNRPGAQFISGILFMIWLVGSAFLFLHKASASRAFLKKLNTGSNIITSPEITACYQAACRELSIRRPPRLLSGPGADTAMLAGMLHPAIILPAARLPDIDALSCILKHELVHYKRKDIWFKWIFQLTACIHFFNPVSHAVCREVNRCCELACDEAVVKNMNTRERRTYGSILLDALETGLSVNIDPVSASLCGNAKFIKERLDTIKMSKKKSTIIKVLTPALTVGLCFGTFCLGAWAAPANPAQGETSAQAQIPAGFTALRTETVSLDDVNKLQLSLSYEDVTIYPSADNTLTYIFCGNNSWNYAENEIASLSLKDGALTLKSGVWNKAWSKLSYRKWMPKIFIYMPADIAGSLSASIGSGSMKSTMAVTADSISLDTASGSMNFSDVSSRGSLIVSNSSGSTKTGSLTFTEGTFGNASGKLSMNAVNAAQSSIFANASGILTAGNITVGANAGGTSDSVSSSDYRCIIGNASGHTELGNITVSGSLELSTASGHMSLGQVSAVTYAASTQSGSLKLAGLHGNGSLSCQSGSIKTGTLVPDGPITMNSGSGSILASIPENTGLEFSVSHTGSGSISAFFPIPGKKSAAGSVVTYGNAPYYPVTAGTQSGSITLNKL